ncbi:DUF4232 domain-containing protein [Streptomyces sp. NBC_01351]|uniref:DUF4232 domain-containing protein n=1 Tax=Streptomyces sp. NBC_01351 TaxID=2903833 RepID=UPI002E30BF55|nr:DUF4232 domain-containing protein [Streptomyces sp. NBC_01351]
MCMKRWVRGVVVAGAVVLGATGCEAAPAPAAARPSVSAVPPAAEACPEGGVRLVEGTGDAAMGLRVEGYELVNCGATDYVLEGYPEIRLLDKAHRPVEVAVGHGSAPITSQVPAVDAAPQRVTLAPGQASSLSVVWRNLVTDATAPAVEGWVLEVTPRPGAPRVSLALSRPVDLGNTGRLGIGPWAAAGR